MQLTLEQQFRWLDYLGYERKSKKARAALKEFTELRNRYSEYLACWDLRPRRSARAKQLKAVEDAVRQLLSSLRNLEPNTALHLHARLFSRSAFLNGPHRVNKPQRLIGRLFSRYKYVGLPHSGFFFRSLLILTSTARDLRNEVSAKGSRHGVTHKADRQATTELMLLYERYKTEMGRAVYKDPRHNINKAKFVAYSLTLLKDQSITVNWRLSSLVKEHSQSFAADAHI